MWAVLIVVVAVTLGGWYGWPAEQRREAVVDVEEFSDDGDIRKEPRLF